MRRGAGGGGSGGEERWRWGQGQGQAAAHLVEQDLLQHRPVDDDAGLLPARCGRRRQVEGGEPLVRDAVLEPVDSVAEAPVRKARWLRARWLRPRLAGWLSGGRPLSAPDRAPGCPELRASRLGWSRWSRWPAISALVLTELRHVASSRMRLYTPSSMRRKASRPLLAIWIGPPKERYSLVFS